jgi:transposase
LDVVLGGLLRGEDARGVHSLCIDPERRRTAVERYLGMDAHAASCTLAILSATGKLMRQDVVETNGGALIRYLRGIPGNLHLCVEEGEWSQWLTEILRPHVKELVVMRGEWRPGSKSDSIDAQELAERLRTRRIGSAVFKDSRSFTSLRELSRAYGMVTRDVARVKNRLKSFFRSRGVSCTGTGVYSPAGRAERAQQLSSATRAAIHLLGRELDCLIALKKDAEQAMLQESSRHRISRVLQTAPGLGPVRVAQLLPIVVTPHRFRTKRQFWAYCGFGVVTRSSADWIQEEGKWVRRRVDQTRGLNFHHNRRLKAIFKGAATTVIAHMGPNRLRADYDRLCEEGTKPNLAKLTIARKIAAIVLAMWKGEQRYDPDRSRRAAGA